MGEATQRWNQDAFVERLTMLMEETGDSTYKLAKIIGCDASTITRWMMKDTIPRTGKLDRIATYYGVNPFWLMGWVGYERSGPIELDGGEQLPAYTPFDFIYETDTDDMMPTIPVRAKVSIREKVIVRTGEIALVEMKDGERVLRRVIQRKHMAVLYADNLAIHPEIYEGDARKDIKIIGKAMTVSFIPK